MMNQRIKKLAEEAKGFVDLNQHVGGDKGCMIYTYDGLEKFAELIISEILEIMNDPKNTNKHTYTTHDMFTIGGALQQIQDVIANKLGVKTSGK